MRMVRLALIIENIILSLIVALLPDEAPEKQRYQEQLIGTQYLLNGNMPMPPELAEHYKGVAKIFIMIAAFVFVRLAISIAEVLIY